MKSQLHQIADQKRSPKKANKLFDSLLDEYYASNNLDKKVRAKLWTECFQTSCNFLKKNPVFQGNWPKLEEWAIDITEIIMRRIENRAKFPLGYRPPSSIATCVFYAFKNVAKAHQKEEEQEAVEVMDYDTYLEELNDRR